MNQLDALKQWTTVVADTGDFRQLAVHQPQDATTNPSLILKAAQQAEHRGVITGICSRYSTRTIDELMDRVLVAFGVQILEAIPGRVSTEVDVRHSFDADTTVTRAQRLMALYRAEGVPAERVLIKIAATWEGMQAAERLEAQGIKTNLTLMFSMAQAVCCAQAGVQLISPFVGRIYDWFKKAAGSQWDESVHAGDNDPGVKFVRAIYAYYKHFGIATEIMGASFRNTRQIAALAGCDLLTISPDLLAQLAASNDPLPVQLQKRNLGSVDRLRYDEASFRFALNEDAMATEKLSEGIRIFMADTRKLEQLITEVAA